MPLNLFNVMHKQADFNLCQMLPDLFILGDGWKLASSRNQFFVGLTKSCFLLIFSVSVPLNLFNVMHKQADLNNPSGGSPAGDQGTLPNNKSDMDAARYVINYCKITQLIQFVWKDQKFVCTAIPWARHTWAV